MPTGGTTWQAHRRLQPADDLHDVLAAHRRSGTRSCPRRCGSSFRGSTQPPWVYVRAALLAVVYLGPLVFLLTVGPSGRRGSSARSPRVVLAGLWVERWWLVTPTLGGPLAFGLAGGRDHRGVPGGLGRFGLVRACCRAATAYRPDGGARRRKADSAMTRTRPTSPLNRSSGARRVAWRSSAVDPCHGPQLAVMALGYYAYFPSRSARSSRSRSATGST